MQVTHVFYDEITHLGMTQSRVRAVKNGEVIHTVVRWSEGIARQEMSIWLAKNTAMFAEHEARN